MSRFPKQVGILVLLVLLVSACSGTSISVSSTSTMIPIQDPSSAPPGTQTPTHTALPTTAAIPSPTAALQGTEEFEIDPTQEGSKVMKENQMIITIGDLSLTATLVENSSTAALKEALSKGPITIHMRDYGSMEKVGSLGMELPRNDEQITTEAGDIILYQGNALVIYYAPNSWNFTRIGKIDDLSADELKEILGDDDVSITISLPQE